MNTVLSLIVDVSSAECGDNGKKAVRRLGAERASSSALWEEVPIHQFGVIPAKAEVHGATRRSLTPLYCDYALLIAKLVSFLSLKGREARLRELSVLAPSLPLRDFEPAGGKIAPVERF
jgi:hypothetical protein